MAHRKWWRKKRREVNWLTSLFSESELTITYKHSLLSNSPRLSVKHTHWHTHTHTQAHSDVIGHPDSKPELTLSLKQSLVCTDQDRGDKKKKKKRRAESWGGGECDHRVKFNHLQFKFSFSTPRLHRRFIHGEVDAHLFGWERHWAGFWEDLFSLSCSVWLLLHSCRTGGRPLLTLLLSTIFSLSLLPLFFFCFTYSLSLQIHPAWPATNS